MWNSGKVKIGERENSKVDSAKMDSSKVEFSETGKITF